MDIDVTLHADGFAHQLTVDTGTTLRAAVRGWLGITGVTDIGAAEPGRVPIRAPVISKES